MLRRAGSRLKIDLVPLHHGHGPHVWCEGLELEVAAVPGGAIATKALKLLPMLPRSTLPKLPGRFIYALVLHVAQQHQYQHHYFLSQQHQAADNHRGSATGQCSSDGRVLGCAVCGSHHGGANGAGSSICTVTQERSEQLGLALFTHVLQELACLATWDKAASLQHQVGDIGLRTAWKMYGCSCSLLHSCHHVVMPSQHH